MINDVVYIYQVHDRIQQNWSLKPVSQAYNDQKIRQNEKIEVKTAVFCYVAYFGHSIVIKKKFYGLAWG